MGAGVWRPCSRTTSRGAGCGTGCVWNCVLGWVGLGGAWMHGGPHHGVCGVRRRAVPASWEPRVGLTCVDWGEAVGRRGVEVYARRGSGAEASAVPCRGIGRVGSLHIRVLLARGHQGAVDRLTNMAQGTNGRALPATVAPLDGLLHGMKCNTHSVHAPTHSTGTRPTWRCRCCPPWPPSTRTTGGRARAVPYGRYWLTHCAPHCCTQYPRRGLGDQPERAAGAAAVPLHYNAARPPARPVLLRSFLAAQRYWATALCLLFATTLSTTHRVLRVPAPLTPQARAGGAVRGGAGWAPLPLAAGGGRADGSSSSSPLPLPLLLRLPPAARAVAGGAVPGPGRGAAGALRPQAHGGAGGAGGVRGGTECQCQGTQ